jgi:hypothetical protein
MNKKILVAYTSKYGSTQKYAQWIASELDADLYAAKTVKPNDLSQYEVVIYGGGLYAGGIAGVKLVTNNPCKSLVVFTVGLADPSSTDYSPIINKNFTPELIAKTKFFHLRGGIDYQKLNPIHRVMMSMMKNLIQKKPDSEKTEEDRDFLATYNTKINFEDKQTIAPLLAYVRNTN